MMISRFFQNAAATEGTVKDKLMPERRFSRESLEELKEIYQKIMDSSDWSVRGYHALFIAWLRKHHIYVNFPNSRIMEDVMAHILTYGEMPPEDLIHG